MINTYTYKVECEVKEIIKKIYYVLFEMFVVIGHKYFI